MPGFIEYNVLGCEKLPPEIVLCFNTQESFSSNLASHIFKYKRLWIQDDHASPSLMLPCCSPQRFVWGTPVLGLLLQAAWEGACWKPSLHGSAVLNACFGKAGLETHWEFSCYSWTLSLPRFLLLAIFIGGATSLLIGNYWHFNQDHFILIWLLVKRGKKDVFDPSF